ncbi:hypothetical protein CLOM621_08384 [Clostridium sp. M62/1]|nr:hypothetical protein CLOM621_08384 [Clostridium sp. M62/1]
MGEIIIAGLFRSSWPLTGNGLFFQNYHLPSPSKTPCTCRRFIL